MLTPLYPWQTRLWQQLCQQLLNNRLPHALLISGVKGLAKNSFAQHLIASVLCLNRNQDQSSCGHCHSCQLVNAGSHPDHIEITPEETGKQIKIDQIRNLRDKQQLTPSISKWKTIIITPADNMNVSSSNSLLKLLEEPRHNTLLILITGHPEKLPITIKSRCQNYHQVCPTAEQAINWLNTNTDNKLDSETLAKLLQLAKGAPLAVVDMLNGEMAEQYTQVENDFNLILKNSVNPIALAASWLKYDLITVLNQLQYMIRERMIESITHSPTTSPDQAKNAVYWQISDCIVKVIKLVSSQNNINNTMLIEDFIVSVMRIANSNMINQ
jgi:DNA polymerase-3 subunit delta'